MIENLTQYRYFFTAAKEGSISAAAKKLFVTQPAVSSMISSLENELGVKLFFRTGRGIRLTYEGEMLYSSVSKAFAFLETGEESIREISGLSLGKLRIGASDMTLRFYLLDLIEEFRRDFPNVSLSVTNAPTPQTLSALRSGNIDLCVVSEPIGESGDLEVFPVRETRDVFIASRRFFDCSRTYSLGELANYPLVMLERTTSTRAFDDEHFRKNGVEPPEPEIELATSDLVLEFVRRGIGIGVVAYDFAAEAIKKGEIAELMLDRPISARHFVLAHLAGVPLCASADEFASRARNYSLKISKNGNGRENK